MVLVAPTLDVSQHWILYQIRRGKSTANSRFSQCFQASELREHLLRKIITSSEQIRLIAHYRLPRRRVSHNSIDNGVKMHSVV